MFVNILHRPGPGAQLEMFRLEQQTAHELGMKTTVMMPCWALCNRQIVEEVRKDQAKFGDEAGLYFGDMDYSSIEGVGESKEPFIWLHTRQSKRAIIDEGLRRYRAAFGRNPSVIGSFHMDSFSLNYIKEKCPEIKITVGGCFEEGVKVYHGCNNSWYLFNEGMPWGPWYPAKENTLRPADSRDDWCQVVAVPHLARDMVLSYEGRNDFFASHPGNVQRAMANEGADMPYAYNMVDMYRYQERFNHGFSYLNVFVSPGWLRGNPYVQDSDEITQKIYKDYLTYLARLKAEGKVEILGMEEFAHWFTENVPVGMPQVYDAKEILYGSGKEYLWYSAPNLRLTLDLCQGGSIGDLRPLVSKTPRCSGADEPDGMFASNPYIIHSQYRSGNSHHYMDGSRSTLLLEHEGEIVDLCNCPVKLEKIEREGELVRFVLTPAKVRFCDGLQAELISIYEVEKDGSIHIHRRLEKCNRSRVQLNACEYIKGCWGITEYPESMENAVLWTEGNRRKELLYHSAGREILCKENAAAGVKLPFAGTEISLEPEHGDFYEAAVQEGILFNPYYTLKVKGYLQPGEEIGVCLKLKKSS